MEPGDRAAMGTPLIDTNAELAAELAVYRAATAVDDNDTRIAGPEQYPPAPAPPNADSNNAQPN